MKITWSNVPLLRHVVLAEYNVNNIYEVFFLSVLKFLPVLHCLN